MRPPKGHWMRVEPLDPAAWPNYRAEAESLGHLAVSAMLDAITPRTIQGVTLNQDACLEWAIYYARAAARNANIELCAREWEAQHGR